MSLGISYFSLFSSCNLARSVLGDALLLIHGLLTQIIGLQCKYAKITHFITTTEGQQIQGTVHSFDPPGDACMNTTFCTCAVCPAKFPHRCARPSAPAPSARSSGAPAGQSSRSASGGAVAPGSRSTAVFDHLTGQQEKTETDSSQRCRVTGGEAMDTNKTFWPSLRKRSFTIKWVNVWTRSPGLVDAPPLNIFKLQLDMALRQPDLTGRDLSRGWTGWHPFQSSLLYNAMIWRQNAFRRASADQYDLTCLRHKLTTWIRLRLNIRWNSIFSRKLSSYLGKRSHTLYLYRASIKDTWNSLNIIKDNNIHHQKNRYISQLSFIQVPSWWEMLIKWRDYLLRLMPCYCSYIYIWLILRHRSGSCAASMEHRKMIPGTSALHTTPKKWNHRTFPQDNIIHMIQTYLCFTACLPFLHCLSEQI